MPTREALCGHVNAATDQNFSVCSCARAAGFVVWASPAAVASVGKIPSANVVAPLFTSRGVVAVSSIARLCAGPRPRTDVLRVVTTSGPSAASRVDRNAWFKSYRVKNSRVEQWLLHAPPSHEFSTLTEGIHPPEHPPEKLFSSPRLTF